MPRFPLTRPPMRLTRGEMITPDESARVYETAKKILAEIGLEICDAGYLERLRACGLRDAGGRVFFDPALVDEHVDAMRRGILSRRDPESRGEPPPDSGRISLHVSSYSLFVHDLDSDQVVPYTHSRLVEMTKLLDSLSGEDVWGTPPGIPTDVAPDLQPLAQYRIAASIARQGATPCDPTAPKTARFLLDMAEVMGRPFHSLPVYMPTPLRLGGESLDVVMACLDRLDHIYVASMPSTGTSSPMHPFGALALAAAEVMGGMIAVKLLTGKPVSCSANIFPADLREGAMVFGSPENMLFQMLGSDFNRFYGWQAAPGPDNIHVMAKMPDAQSAAEKAAILAAGAMLGTRHFSCAGTLSLDEIFSAEQLLLDCEIRDWAERAIQGVWLGEEAVDDWVEEIRAGIEGGFIQLDSTLDSHRKHTWYPRFFARGAIGPWLKADQPALSAALKADARRRIAAHNFELPREQRQALDELYAAAERAVGLTP